MLTVQDLQMKGRGAAPERLPLAQIVKADLSWVLLSRGWDASQHLWLYFGVDLMMKPGLLQELQIAEED